MESLQKSLENGSTHYSICQMSPIRGDGHLYPNGIQQEGQQLMSFNMVCNYNESYKYNTTSVDYLTWEIAMTSWYEPFCTLGLDNVNYYSRFLWPCGTLKTLPSDLTIGYRTALPLETLAACNLFE